MPTFDPGGGGVIWGQVKSSKSLQPIIIMELKKEVLKKVNGFEKNIEGNVPYSVVPCL